MKNTVVIFLLFISTNLFSQDVPVPGSAPDWDNQIYLGNKVAAGKNKWRYSGEIQVRLKDDTQNLDNYFVEGVASYLISEKWEIVPDFRMSIKPGEFEYRPGLGVVYKFVKGNFQYVNQFKWQTDFSSNEKVEHGLRYAIFLNYLIHDKYIPNFVAGVFYRWKDDFTGMQYIRFGPGLAFVFDVKHILNFNYMISVKNYGQEWGWAGIPVVQLIININKEYKYMPAKYFSF